MTQHNNVTVGLLALQGDFAKHQERIESLGAKTVAVRNAKDLDAAQGLIIPGGESTVLLKLANAELRQSLKTKISAGLPVLATCAGVIFLARNVKNPAQESLDLIDIDVTRNAYGRQIDSFIEPNLHLTDAGCTLIDKLSKANNSGLKEQRNSTFEGVFIRAPKITRVGSGVSVIIQHEGDPILVSQNNILAATFHPELSPENTIVHALFLSMIC